MRAYLAQLGRFGSVGVLATLVHLAVAWIAARGAEAAPFTANAIGYCAAFAVSYLGHFYWTFEQRAGHGVRLPRFLVVSGAGYAISNLVVWIFVTQARLAFEYALIGILIAVPLATWLLSRLWAFR